MKLKPANIKLYIDIKVNDLHYTIWFVQQTDHVKFYKIKFDLTVSETSKWYTERCTLLM